MGISLNDLPDSGWIWLPVVAIFLIPNWYVGQKDRTILVDLRAKVYRILIVLALLAAVLFLCGVISLGFALLGAAPLFDYIVWGLLYKRFLRVHGRQPRNMFLNMDSSRSTDPDRFYALAVAFSTVLPPVIVPIVLDRLMPIILWR